MRSLKIRFITAAIVLLSSLQAQASIKTMFHPYDPTMNEIAEYIMKAESTIDLALYNIDASKSNPVIAAFGTKEIQERLKSGDLIVRILFEGYDSKENNQKKMAQLEALGLDAKYLGVGRKMHHKFATIDTNSRKPVLITGSANWSMSSQRNYNENIIYLEDKPGITSAFQKQFNLLWSQSKEFGNKAKEDERQQIGTLPVIKVEEGFEVHFNTENLKVTPRGFRKDSSKKGFVLTREVVALINNAESRIEIATTRLKLRPIYEALKAAAARGVKIDLVVTMGEYAPSYYRNRSKIKKCESIFDEKCSTSQNFSIFLEREDYVGKENVTVRIKHFDIRKDSYLQKQMHSKYMIVDNKTLITGSFNWSVSAEYNHFENIITISGEHYPKVLEDFNQDFDRLWNLNRKSFEPFVDELEKKSERSERIKCGYEPMTLTFTEIDHMLSSAKRVGGTSLLKLCQ
jgi:phosphatidylserine/phosphatidylglycerophosphate/cardiolipin synthase-like enzyme